MTAPSGRRPDRTKLIVEAAVKLCDAGSFIALQNDATALAVITKAVGALLSVLSKFLSGSKAQ